MSDLDAALEPVREILERRDAARRNGTSDFDLTKVRLEETLALLEQPVPPSPPARSANSEQIDQHLAEVREVVKRLRNGSH